MLHVRCCLAAEEITECCKRALQDFSDGNSTFDEMIQAMGGPYRAEKPVLKALLRKGAKSLKKDGRIDSRKLKAVSWEVPEVDDHKAEKRSDGTTPVHAGGMVVVAAGDHKADQRPDGTMAVQAGANAVTATGTVDGAAHSIDDVAEVVEGPKTDSDMPIHGY